MTHTYQHQFANGVKATATVATDPPTFNVQWEGKPSLTIVPEYQRWRQTVLEDFTQRTGKRVAVLDLA